ncbi:hypothetical protein D9613_003077 [Agrocybe pediades]|uniref:Protein kinase domain-containing protein n=1 Tax=Agrocybe pediades TaxID=84607 RepID=A0A8H4QS03_9AGAR|nr:hypothetical protein D9613_003077 [Agrocybe pediades]
MYRPSKAKSFTRQYGDVPRSSLDRDDVPASPTSSDSSIDEEEVNRRARPYWPKYRSILKSRGFRLDTVRDVKLLYGSIGRTSSTGAYVDGNEDLQDENALCPDAGLPDNLFRGTRISDSKRVVFKAVHAGSREFSIIRTLSQPPMVYDQMNHTIPVVDLFEIPKDDIAFIVMEEWSSNLVASSGAPCCITCFLSALRQMIEHIAFLHMHRIAHLDISLMNLLTDYNGRYAYIDYENSRNFRGVSNPLVYNYRGTELPPESEKNIGIDPFKVDVWALGVLILRACKSKGYFVPDLMYVVNPMLEDDPARRPTAFGALQMYDKITGYRLEQGCKKSHI